MAVTYADLDEQIQKHFGDADYQTAFDLATGGLDQFPSEHPMLNYWRMCAAARMDDRSTVYRILSQALETGFWYGEALLRNSPSFKPLLNDPAFELFIGLCRDKQKAEAGVRELRLLMRDPGEKPPLLVALHGNQSSPVNTQPFWVPAAQQGWLVALPQSSEMMWKGAYMWSDPEEADAEVLTYLNAMEGQHPYDLQRIVMGGHSMGGETAIWLALNGFTDVRGFVVIGPGGPLCDEPEKWQPIIEDRASTTLRGYFILGGKDTLILPDKVREVARMLNAAGIPCEVEEVPEATHDLHPGYADALMRGLAFVLNT